MKSKALAATAIAEFALILLLAGFLVTRFVTFTDTSPLVREPAAPGESSLIYSPPPPPKIPLEVIRQVREFKKDLAPQVVQVADGIYNARGFALGNVQMVVTREGLVIIDSTENRSSAAEIMAEFRKITNLPVRYLIYTHSHVDHVYGAAEMVAEGTQVIATSRWVETVKRNFGRLAPLLTRSRHVQAGRAAPAFATPMPISSPVRLPEKMTTDDIVWPTVTFEDDYAFTLGGRRFELAHTTGETDDHLRVWLPEEKVLFCGDLYYYSFPNLSTPMLRPRPVKGWYLSLERMAELEAEVLISGHFKAVTGKERVASALAVHAAAIRTIYDQTLACINAGKPLEQAVEEVRLPDELAGQPQLLEVYGRVDWSVRGIYQREVGWYDGRGSGLAPLPAAYRARELVKISGGADKVLQRAITVQQAGEHQLACELCDVVIAANPEDKTARMIKAASLEYLAYQGGNLNMFGFYRSAAAMEREVAGVKP